LTAFKILIIVPSPLDLFELIKFNFLACPYLDLFLIFKFSNLIFTLILFIFILFFFFFILRTINNLVISKLSIFFNLIFNLLKNIIREILSTEKNIHLPLFFFLFILLLFCNLGGILPYSLSVTSHFSITFTLAFIFFIGFNIIGLSLHTENFICLFLPRGTPIIIVPFIILIEIISYITRIFSLAIRLFANIISGHTLLKILGTFAWAMLINGSIWIFLSIFPFFIIFLIVGLECAIAALQAYVFTILLLIYLKDVLYLH